MPQPSVCLSEDGVMATVTLAVAPACTSTAVVPKATDTLPRLKYAHA